MSSWVQKTQSGRWIARYRAPDGKTRSKTWDRKTDAERWLRVELGRRDRGEWGRPEAREDTIRRVGRDRGGCAAAHAGFDASTGPIRARLVGDANVQRL